MCLWVKYSMFQVVFQSRFCSGIWIINKAKIISSFAVLQAVTKVSLRLSRLFVMSTWHASEKTLKELIKLPSKDPTAVLLWIVQVVCWDFSLTETLCVRRPWSCPRREYYLCILTASALLAHWARSKLSFSESKIWTWKIKKVLRKSFII